MTKFLTADPTRALRAYVLEAPSIVALQNWRAFDASLDHERLAHYLDIGYV